MRSFYHKNKHALNFFYSVRSYLTAWRGHGQANTGKHRLFQRRPDRQDETGGGELQLKDPASPFAVVSFCSSHCTAALAVFGVPYEERRGGRGESDFKQVTQ